MPDLVAGLTRQVLVTSTPVLTVHAGYANGDYVGTSGVAQVLLGCARGAGMTGYIRSAVLIDAVSASVAGELWIFDDLVTPPADSAAWTISDADALHCIGIIPSRPTTPAP